MSNIQDKNKWYNFVFRLVRIAQRGAYTSIEFKHLEKVPQSGSLIFTPNHSSALMDAIAVLSVSKKPTVFVARGDLHRNPLANKMLRFLKILPIARQRDGLGEVKKNGKTMSESEDALLHGVPFGIMPEGAEQTKRSLLPFGKGVCRIALNTLEHLPDDQPFYIVPVGITHGDYFHFRSTLYVEVGDPIDLRAFVKAHEGKETPEMRNAIKKELRARIMSLIPYLDADEDYEESYDLLLLDNKRRAKKLAKEDSTSSHFALRMRAMRETSRVLTCMKHEKNAQYLKAVAVAKHFEKTRKSLHVMDQTLMYGTSIGKFLASLLINLLILPFFLYSTIISLPVLGLIKWLNLKIKDNEFDNTVRFSVNLLISPLIWIIWIVVFFSFLEWSLALMLSLLVFPAFRIVQDCFYRMRRFRSDFNYLFNKTMKKSKQELERLDAELLA